MSILIKAALGLICMVAIFFIASIDSDSAIVHIYDVDNDNGCQIWVEYEVWVDTEEKEWDGWIRGARGPECVWMGMELLVQTRESEDDDWESQGPYWTGGTYKEWYGKSLPQDHWEARFKGLAKDYWPYAPPPYPIHKADTGWTKIG